MASRRRSSRALAPLLAVGLGVLSLSAQAQSEAQGEAQVEVKAHSRDAAVIPDCPPSP